MCHGVAPNVSALNAATTFLSLFMVVFMLLSTFITGKIFLGAAPVAMMLGAIFGPKAAAIFDPLSWTDADTVTLEFSRIVLAIQSFGNAIELPRRYLFRHWTSLAYIIGPVMLTGWLITTCILRFMVPAFDWRQALACAACFNAIDPVLAATVLSGTFSQRVPLHTRNLLRLEAAANGLVTTVILDLTTNLLIYRHSLWKAFVQTFSLGLAYGSLFGALAGMAIGYAARIIARRAHEGDTIDRPSFLAYYLSVALFSTGFGTIIGVDEINLAFFAGVGLDNDNWYEELTRETFLSSCIDLMLNLSYFAYIGSLVPWNAFHSQTIGLMPWRLVFGTLLLFLFRRLPWILLAKMVVKDIYTWREALFYGHFGPVGAGSLFAALQIRGRLTEAKLTSSDNTGSQNFIEQLWTVSMFVVVCSTAVHGTSVAVFYFAQRVQAMRISISYSTGHADGPSWMKRLPRIQSRSKSSMSSGSRPSLTLEGLTGPVLRRRTEVNPGLPALAYQFGNTIIVEDENGEVIKKYDISAVASTSESNATSARKGTQPGRSDLEGQAQTARNPSPQPTFTISGGRRMAKEEFFQQMHQLDPKKRDEPVASSQNLGAPAKAVAPASGIYEGETDVERRRREDALGNTPHNNSDQDRSGSSNASAKGKGPASEEN